ncbi:MAG: outer membrane protein assembly factor BamD [Campylobacteraceae bacterium]|nr:outer membrane protein assembly factor BamD [Campylobacteraceae bacterium]
MRRKLFIFVAAFILFAGCASKDPVLEYNKSAEYWYNEIIKAIIMSDLEKADSLYISLSSEHVASPLISEALLILTQANIDEEKYVEANKYLDEYIKKFGSSMRNEYARYLKITAYYASFSLPNRNQQLILTTIKDIKQFVKTYPNSPYIPMVKTMLVQMELGANLMSENAAALYKKLNKNDAVEFYKEQSDKTYEKEGEIINPTTPWYRKWFE